MVVGPLVPEVLRDLLEAGSDLMEVHECLTVATPGAGPLLVDVTWNPATVRAGLPGTLNWNGVSDMICAVQPVSSYAVAEDFRAQKEMLRSRLIQRQIAKGVIRSSRRLPREPTKFSEHDTINVTD